MITAIILNWKRPANVARIVEGWRGIDIVTEAIVWNNNPNTTYAHASAHVREWAKAINCSSDCGLYTRFAAACLAKNECVLIQDDDLELPSETIRRLYAAWQRESDIVHGLFGRRPGEDGAYIPKNTPAGEVPIVLTRALVAHRRYAPMFFAAAPHFANLQTDSIPHGNGEDIIFSYVVRRASRKMNRVHRLPARELLANDPIHRRSGHKQHRTKIVKACEAWLKSEE